ncbi:NAD(P)-dependent oxidoreductase [Allokutzneria multivorans]|uniref:NAD(P)-dependent oxidoreductase n=1 Tax=Allokutzneria multivorans TaxID=1142134 RepID=A0ABP7SSY0_9PSEU
MFGAAGSVGSRVMAEARSRGHSVTGVTRDATRFPELRRGNAADVEDVIALSRGQDLVISATRPATGREAELVTTTKAVLAGLAETGVRLLMVGGAASLTVPGTGTGTGTGTTVLDDPNLPPEIRAIAEACDAQLAVCRAETVADWAYLSPPALLEPGARTGSYRLGRDELIVDAEGNSTISMEDLAVALLDEAERPRHRRTRFTVGY